jgi:HlyD family secretion protein
VNLPAVSKALLIPNAALRQRGARTGVWVPSGGTLRFVSIDAGAEGTDGMLQVRSGLKAGDTVIVHSEESLDEGKRIRIARTLTGGPQ